MMSARASASPAPLPVVPLDTWSVGQRLVHRSAAALQQATLGSGGNHPNLPLQVPDPIHLLLGPLPDTSSDSDVPGPPGQSSAGVTHTTRSATHPVHLWLAGQTSASGVGVLGVAGMARFSAAGPTGLRRDHCRDRPGRDPEPARTATTRHRRSSKSYKPVMVVGVLWSTTTLREPPAAGLADPGRLPDLKGSPSKSCRARQRQRRLGIGAGHAMFVGGGSRECDHRMKECRCTGSPQDSLFRHAFAFWSEWLREEWVMSGLLRIRCWSGRLPSR